MDIMKVRLYSFLLFLVIILRIKKPYSVTCYHMFDNVVTSYHFNVALDFIIINPYGKRCSVRTIAHGQNAPPLSTANT